MTTTLGTPDGRALAERRQPVALCAVVAIGTIVGWIAYDHWAYPHLVRPLLDHDVLVRHTSVLFLGDVLLRYGPYAVVLLVWGRTAGRRVGGFAVAIVACLYLWGLYEVFTSYVWHDLAPTARSADVYTWANLLVLPTLLALAWGVARRWGAVWPLGLVVAPLVAAALYELSLHSAWWARHVLFQQHLHWLVSAVLFLAPPVAGAVACRLLDRRPDMQTSA